VEAAGPPNGRGKTEKVGKEEGKSHAWAEEREAAEVLVETSKAEFFIEAYAYWIAVLDEGVEATEVAKKTGFCRACSDDEVMPVL
jgi:hypothetical protein